MVVACLDGSCQDHLVKKKTSENVLSEVTREKRFFVLGFLFVFEFSFVVLQFAWLKIEEKWQEMQIVVIDLALLRFASSGTDIIKIMQRTVVSSEATFETALWKFYCKY